MAMSTVQEFLGLRQQLKEAIRMRNRGISTITETVKKPPYNNFGGCFFGPSEPTIAKRVIQESKNLASIKLNDLLTKNQKYSTGESSVKAIEVKQKIQQLKMSRDYSFLNDNYAKHQSSTQPSLQTSEILMRKPALGHNDEKLQPRTPAKVSGERKSVSCKSVKATSMDSKKLLSCKTSLTPVQPKSSKAVEKKPNGSISANQNKNTTSDQMQNSNSKPSLKFKIKPVENISKIQHKVTNSDQKQNSNSKPSLMSKTKMSQPIPSSKAKVSSESRGQVQRSKKRQLSETELAFKFIREAFNTERFRNRDDRDVGNMEANFTDILKEERKSAKLARKEDAEQLRLIEEEEKREKIAKEEKREKIAKRRKVHH